MHPASASNGTLLWYLSRLLTRRLHLPDHTRELKVLLCPDPLTLGVKEDIGGDLGLDSLAEDLDLRGGALLGQVDRKICQADVPAHFSLT